MCTARKGVKDLSILPQGLSAVFMDGLSPFFHSYFLKEFRGAEDGNRA
jgi:hypothetical protein